VVEGDGQSQFAGNLVSLGLVLFNRFSYWRLAESQRAVALIRTALTGLQHENSSPRPSAFKPCGMLLQGINTSGLAAKELAQWMSGLKPGPIQYRSSPRTQAP
jgi:hypothetical protein